MLYIIKIQEDSPHLILDVYMFYLTVVMIYYSLSTLSSLDVLEEHFFSCHWINSHRCRCPLPFHSLDDVYTSLQWTRPSSDQ